MLKSTYRSAAPAARILPLAKGWTEHKAPTGHIYYYNAATKQSTYTRPVVEENEDQELQIDYNATEPDHVVRASLQILEEFHQNNDIRGQGEFTGGRSYQDRSRRRDHGDRPKTKKEILNSAPWVLVMTKMGRRFVHNTETKESLYKFPSDIMMAVIEMDRIEWEAKKKAESQPAKEDPELIEMPSQGKPDQPSQARLDDPYDSDSYEEVEVTDDETEDGDADPSYKRPRLPYSQPSPPHGPVEFDEDDIAWQLAQMEEDNDDYRPEDYASDEDVGLPITEADTLALFRSLLDDFHISPYSTFERVIEDPSVVDDPRYTSLPTTSARRDAFTDWSRNRVAELQEREKYEAATTKRKDPRVTYLQFLQKCASVKQYWPEFKRKYKKSTEMRDLEFSDKEREKLYREYASKLKLSEGDRRKELVGLLRGVPKGELNRQSTVEDLPDELQRDLRFYILSESKRDELVAAHLATLGD